VYSCSGSERKELLASLDRIRSEAVPATAAGKLLGGEAGKAITTYNMHVSNSAVRIV
jgi:hypothetical protein